MRKVLRTSLVMLGSATLIGGMALPASAEDVKSGENVATVEIKAGFLILDTKGSPLDLGTAVASVDTTIVTGTLSDINVSDLNSDGLGWVSTVSLDALKSSTEPLDTIDLAGASYVSTMTTQSGTVVTGDGTESLTAPVGGNSNVTFATTVTVNIPNTVKAGTYTGTLTHSLL